MPIGFGRMKRTVQSLLILFTAAVSLRAEAQAPAQVKGIRLDPGYVYSMAEYSKMKPAALASFIVNEVKAGGFNTIYLYVYSGYYGAYYPTTYQNAVVEGGLGVKNFAKLVTDSAKLQGLQTIAVIPTNDYKGAWDANPAWRIKTNAGADYKPRKTVNYLSPSHPAYRSWFKGLVRDLITRIPNLAGVEAVEPGYDLNWKGTVDYNPEAVAKFQALNPGVPANGTAYRLFRAQELTDYLGDFAELVHSYGKQVHVVQTWTAKADGTLMTSNDMKLGLGLDWDGLLNLPTARRVDWINAEFMYQQWLSSYGTSVFTPAWTYGAAASFVSFVNGRAHPIIHVEYSPFSGAYGTYSANLSDIDAALSGVLGLAEGTDIYDYHFWIKLKRGG